MTSAPRNPTTIPGTQSFRITSEQIGQEYVIDLDLPEPVRGDSKAGPAPVVLVLDGTTTFPLVSSTVRFLRMYGDIGPVAVVGVGYPDAATMVETMPQRTRDLTPTDGEAWWHGHFLGHTPDAPPYVGSGGADAFLSFLQEQVLPEVAERGDGQLDLDRIALHGHSFGGLFGLHTLFTAPTVFHDYLIGSPSIWWDDRVLIRTEEATVGRSTPAGRVFMAVGGSEPAMMPGDVYAMEARLRGREDGLDLTTCYLPGETHKSSVPSFTVHGLRHLYGAPTS